VKQSIRFQQTDRSSALYDRRHLGKMLAVTVIAWRSNGGVMIVIDVATFKGRMHPLSGKDNFWYVISQCYRPTRKT